MRNKNLTIDLVVAIVASNLATAELDEKTDFLFDTYKQLRAEDHLAEMGLTKEKRELMEAVGAKAIECARESNIRTGLARWKTTLPSLEECFDRDYANQEAEAVAASATTTQPQDVAAGTVVNNAPPSAPATEGTQGSQPQAAVAEQPAKVDGNGSAAAPKRKGRLDDQTVAEIRNHLSEGKMKQGEIAKMYGIDPSTVSDIKVGRGRYGKDTAAAPVAAPTAEAPAPGVDVAAPAPVADADVIPMNPVPADQPAPATPQAPVSEAPVTEGF